VNITKVKGVLYRGDEKTIESKKNSPLLNEYWTVLPEELAVAFRLRNEEEASQFMVKSVDFNEDARTPMPDVVSPSEL